MGNTNGFPKFRLKIVFTSILVISVTIMLDSLAWELTTELMHGNLDAVRIILDTSSFALRYGLFPGIIVGLLINLYLKPVFHNGVILFSGDTISDQERELSISRMSGLTRVVILLNILAYFIEFIMIIILHEVRLEEFIILFLKSLSSAFIFGTIQSNLINYFLVDVRSLFKIFSIENRKKRISMQIKNISLTLFLILYVTLNLVNAAQLVRDSDIQYQTLLNKVVDGEMTINSARNEYIKMSSQMLGVDDDHIIFPYDSKDISNPMPIYIVFIFHLLIISSIYQFTSTMFLKKQINDLNVKMIEIGKGRGDLTKQVEITQFNETGELTHSINIFLNSLRSMLKEVKIQGKHVEDSVKVINQVLEETENSTQNIVSANEQTARSTDAQVDIANDTTANIRAMLNSVKEIAENIEVQASSVEQTSTAVNEMAANIDSVNQSTKRASDLSTKLVKVADDGGSAVNQSITAVKRVEEYSDEIIDMVKSITEISDKTNLLAMNAAIEAAHAGESGRGFAVVAQEVRKLAEDSAISAKQISENINTMGDLVNDGVNLSEGAGSALNVVGNDVKRTNQLIEEISAAMEEQSTGTKEVLEAVTALMESTRSIKHISNDQKAKNSEMSQSIEDLTVSFTEIKTATKEQSDGTKRIQKSVSELKEVIKDNEKATDKLKNLLGGFKL